jgi:hypothetical protein
MNIITVIENNNESLLDNNDYLLCHTITTIEASLDNNDYLLQQASKKVI